MKYFIRTSILYFALMGFSVSHGNELQDVSRYHSAIKDVPDSVYACLTKSIEKDLDFGEKDPEVEALCSKAKDEFPPCFGEIGKSRPFKIWVPITSLEKLKSYVLIEDPTCQNLGRKQAEAIRQAQPKSSCEVTNEVRAAIDLDLVGRPRVTRSSNIGSEADTDLEYVDEVLARGNGNRAKQYQFLMSKLSPTHVLVSKYFTLDNEMGFAVVQDINNCVLSMVVTDLANKIIFSNEPFELTSWRKLSFSFKMEKSNSIRTYNIDNRSLNFKKWH